MKETGPRLSYALAAAYGVEVERESTADALAYAWELAGRSEQGDPTGTETPGFVSVPGATHIAGYALPDLREPLVEREQNAGSRTPRIEVIGRRLRRYAWFPQTVDVRSSR